MRLPVILLLILILSSFACTNGNQSKDGESSPPSYSEPDPELHGFPIVFRSNMDDQAAPDIYFAPHYNWENIVQITDTPATESFPCVTKGERWIYFITDAFSEQSRLGKTTEICRIPILSTSGRPTGDIERLTESDTLKYGLSISNFGEEVVFMAASLTNPELASMYLATADFSTIRKIIEGNPSVSITDLEHPETPLLNSLPKISRGGRHIVFNAMDATGDMDIWSFDHWTSELVKIVDTEFHEYFPSISEGGTVIAFERIYSDDITDEHSMEIILVDRNGENEVRLTDDAFSDTFPVISPFGDWVLFTSKRWEFTGDGEYDEALYYMNVDDREIFKFTDAPYFQEQADWSNHIIAF